ncbi:MULTISPECIES: DNA mismatch repair endonuclease MutL [Bacillus]|uniref:DNA mismatch repair protein MutL n=2 Tax=Bacillus TaxID=1386 RepID=A0A0M4FW89_9BACI|nr:MULTISPECIES: DNA mismatch repair endonuclease MutL [Bacillus]ALC81125.1 DNA mismatch repair protein MutL [Bacillus gobiensis]MBP1080091.1 DNA mismatch repair protein MutL [Bacillus capparidis]MED1095478.1 DNA mismatch repair endonuclease MutL [Bacillus capparidis]
MQKVIKLSAELSNKIAAGEVVERPASVVKELVENSIDANSTVIEVDIEEAGLSSIQVRDNGEGMSEIDAKTAFSRHATSKIKDENDLFRVRTLGFRGEALPSIASVSHLELVTSTGQEAGSHLTFQGGKLIAEGKASGRQGSEITVTQLFFNTPARLKYMKTIHTELGNITDLLNRLALAHPDVSFRLRHNGKEILKTSGNGDVRHVLASIYGTAIAKKMIPIHVQSLDFNVKGYLSLPEVTRASRSYISTVINGRYIRNFSLSKAIEEGYHTLLPIGRHPIVYLEITMDPILVDVNVHPSKLEVRISKESELHTLISDGVKNQFQRKQLIPSVAPPKRTSAAGKNEQQTLSLDSQSEKLMERKVEKPPVYESHFKTEDLITESRDEESSYQESVHEEAQEEEMPSTSIEQEEEPIEKVIPEERVPVMYPIGQMHGTYILAQNENGLYIIDQHAAQERIKYEYFREKVGQVEHELQELLVPLTLHYSSHEAVIIDEYKHELERVGVFLESFGSNSYIVRSHPSWFPNGEESMIIEDIIQQVLEEKKADIKKLREEAAIMMSCKGSIKANHYLKQEDMKALLDELRTTSEPFTCPHGRPIIIHFTSYEMEKMFKRVM